MRTSQKTPETITTIGIDLGKNTFHLVGMDKRGAIALQRKVSRSRLEHRLCNVPRCLIGMEACSGSHHIGRQLTALGHDVRLIPAQYVKPFLKGHKNDYRDAEAVAEAVQRPTMHFVTIKTPEQMDLLALHRVRSRLVGQRTGTINQIRGFLIERGIIVRQGVVPLRKALPDILSSNTNILSPRMVSLIAGLDPENTIVIETTKGQILVKLRRDVEPLHAERIKTVAREGYYDNVPFHRVMDGFMAQTGDGQNFNGTGRSKYPNLKQEFSKLHFARGIVGMARSGDSVDTANSQFFIMYANSPALDGNCTVVGEVVQGMDVGDRLKKASPDSPSGGG